MHINNNETSISSYYLEYDDNFLYRGSVEFKYRANMRQSSNGVVNGIFIFTVDDIDQNVGSDYFESGMWNVIIRELPPGPHRLVWKYTRYDNLEAG